MSTMDNFHFTCFRLPTRERRDEMRKAVQVVGPDKKPVPNIDDYVGTGIDEQGYYLLVMRDKEMKEDVVFTYTSDGSILKNNVNPLSYKDFFKQ